MTRQEFKDILLNEAIARAEDLQAQYGHELTKDERYEALTAALKALTGTITRAQIDFSVKDIPKINLEIIQEWVLQGGLQ